MTKIEMSDMLNRIVCAVEALPDGADPIAAYVCGRRDYVQLSSSAETPPALEVAEVEGDNGPYKEYRAEVLGVSVIWIE